MAEVIRHFLYGAGSIIQIMPSSPNIVNRPDFMRVPDAARIASDWRRVGDDIRIAMLAVDRKDRADGPTQQT